MRIKLFLVIITIIIITTNLYSSNKKFNSTITIKSDKEQYYIYDPVFIEYEFINKDLISPKIDPNHRLQSNFNIKDEYGTYYSPNIEFGFIESKRKPINVKTIQDGFFLFTLYGKSFPIGGLHFYLPIGKYTITCVWMEDNYEPIISNTIHIEIIDTPIQYNDEKVLFEKAVNIGYLGYNIDNQNKFFTFMDEYIAKYPQGIYREYCLKLEMKYSYHFNYPLRGKKAADIMINDYPETRFPFSTIDALANYYKKTNQIKEGIEYINEIKMKTTNIEIKKECDWQLKELMKVDEK